MWTVRFPTYNERMAVISATVHMWLTMPMEFMALVPKPDPWPEAKGKFNNPVNFYNW